ncbi:MAG: transposase [Verrucomicrobia bacterium]|jgi:REP element-mobilizing transposase RayT|nr:transposase [Verrucomicrobiota bacterium]
MRENRIKYPGAIYHCMTRTVAGERLFENREKEVLRKMLWQVAEFSGGEVLTYCLMSNHFHVLIDFPEEPSLSDQELMRRYRVLYPKPNKYQLASARALERKLAAGGEEAEAIREQLLARMGDVSEFMKTLKQRFSIWYNQKHGRFGTLWSERFKSVLVEGRGFALQTMAAYIDLNPLRAGLVDDPKDYRFCGYAEAVGGATRAVRGLQRIWSVYGGPVDGAEALRAHRMLLFGKGTEADSGGRISHEKALQVLEKEGGVLPRSVALRCRIRYFTDGAILGSAEFVRGFRDFWQKGRQRPIPEAGHALVGADWGDMAVVKRLKRDLIS